MFRPTLTINGIHGGYGGPGSKSVLPSKAVAKCEMRLVDSLTPATTLDLVERHVRRHAPEGEVQFVPRGGFLPSKTPLDSPFSASIVRAVQIGQRTEDVLIYPGTGASLPDAIWTKQLGVPAFVTPYANHDEDNHAPNENLEIAAFVAGIRTGAALLSELGKLDTGATCK